MDHSAGEPKPECRPRKRPGPLDAATPAASAGWNVNELVALMEQLSNPAWRGELAAFSSS
jgi:hypothetical protein